MAVKIKTRGYAHEVYEVTAAANETLTKERVIEELKKEAGFFFGYDFIQFNNTLAVVKIYID